MRAFVKAIMTISLGVALVGACAPSAPKQPEWFDAYMACKAGCGNECALHQSEVFVLCDGLCDRSCKERHWPSIVSRLDGG